MRKTGTVATSLFAAMTLASTGLTQAALYDRGNGLIYDSVLNVTWLQDVGYAATSGYDSDGLFNWDDAQTWVSQLDYAGIKGWRLPNIKPVNGLAANSNFSTNGSTDYGYNIAYPGRTNPFDAPSVSAGFTGNELAYMFYVELGNLATFKVDGTPRTGTYKVDFGLVNTSFVDATSGQTETFKNLSVVGDISLWTSSPGNSIYTFSFNGTGFSDFNNKQQLFGAWAVHDGDVAASLHPAGLLSVTESVLLQLYGSGSGAQVQLAAARLLDSPAALVPEPPIWILVLSGWSVIVLALRRYRRAVPQ